MRSNAFAQKYFSSTYVTPGNWLEAIRGPRTNIAESNYPVLFGNAGLADFPVLDIGKTVRGHGNGMVGQAADAAVRKV
jgi:hypothetical protein